MASAIGKLAARKAPIGHEAQHHSQNPEQYGVRHTDEGQADADDKPEQDIECSLCQEVSAKALARHR